MTLQAWKATIVALVGLSLSACARHELRPKDVRQVQHQDVRITLARVLLAPDEKAFSVELKVRNNRQTEARFFPNRVFMLIPSPEGPSGPVERGIQGLQGIAHQRERTVLAGPGPGGGSLVGTLVAYAVYAAVVAAITSDREEKEAALRSLGHPLPPGEHRSFKLRFPSLIIKDQGNSGRVGVLRKRGFGEERDVPASRCRIDLSKSIAGPQPNKPLRIALAVDDGHLGFRSPPRSALMLNLRLGAGPLIQAASVVKPYLETLAQVEAYAGFRLSDDLGLLVGGGAGSVIHLGGELSWTLLRRNRWALATYVGYGPLWLFQDSSGEKDLSIGHGPRAGVQANLRFFERYFGYRRPSFALGLYLHAGPIFMPDGVVTQLAGGLSFGM